MHSATILSTRSVVFICRLPTTAGLWKIQYSITGARVLTLPAYCRGVDCTSPGLEQELRQQTGLIDHKEHSLSNSKNCRIELQERDIRISMDGKGRALDNILVERLWRSVKHEWLYLHEFQTVPELDAGLNEYFTFYNTERLHQSLSYKMPQAIHFA